MVHLTSSFLTVLVLLQSSCGAPKLWGAGYGLDSAGSSRALLETSLSAIAAGNITYITHGGAESSVILTSTGVLYSWGSNTYGIESCKLYFNSVGQLGDGSNAAKYTPVLVNTAVTSSTISRVRCGSYTCIALSSANELIGFGHNTYGEEL
jgi:alpha-tubulin suppressor-like RCC1 family protein